MSIIPVGTFWQRVRIIRPVISPFCWGITTVYTTSGTGVSRRIPSITYLAIVLNRYMRVVQNMTVFATTIDGTFDEGVATDKHLCVICECCLVQFVQFILSGHGS